MTVTASGEFVSKSTTAAITEILGTLNEAGNGSVMTSMHDDDGNYTWASSTSEGLFGYKPRELVGVNAWEFIHPDDTLDTRASQWAVQTGQSTKVTYRLRCKNGSYRTVESVAWDSPDFGTVVVTKPLD